jgi:hypothetical protein
LLDRCIKRVHVDMDDFANGHPGYFIGAGQAWASWQARFVSGGEFF